MPARTPESLSGSPLATLRGSPVTSKKPTNALLLLSVLLLTGCVVAPPKPVKLPPPAPELMSPQSESFLTELEKILSRKPSEATK